MTRAPRYLSLDISKFTGYALVEGNQLIKSGVRDFSVKASEHIGKRGIKFYNFLLSIGQVDEIYYEKVMFSGGFKNAAGNWTGATNDGRELYHGFLMLVNMYAAGFGIPLFGIHVSTLKKQFTGNGHADKEQMVARAHELGWKGGQVGTSLYHDQVDAIALLETQLRLNYNIKMIF